MVMVIVTVSIVSFLLFGSLAKFSKQLNVTVQFETKGNGQNEIVSHMDRSEVKL